MGLSTSFLAKRSVRLAPAEMCAFEAVGSGGPGSAPAVRISVQSTISATVKFTDACLGTRKPSSVA